MYTERESIIYLEHSIRDLSQERDSGNPCVHRVLGLTRRVPQYSPQWPCIPQRALTKTPEPRRKTRRVEPPSPQIQASIIMLLQT